MTALFELRDLATTLARSAGVEILRIRAEAGRDGFDPVSGQHGTKSSSVDLVTVGDHRAEELIVDGITRARPDDGLLGEEGAQRAGSSGVRWVIDPIDGTTNYVYGYPGFTVSIAAEVDGRPTVGVVYDPTGDALYAAVAGNGATRNDRPIAASRADDLSRSLVGTGFAYRADRRAWQAGVLGEVLPRVRDIRRSGSAAYDLCSVADGRLDAYYERGLNAWDLAAGALIAAEAGAVVSDLADGPAGPEMTVAAAPGIHAALCALLGSAGAGDGP